MADEITQDDVLEQPEIKPKMVSDVGITSEDKKVGAFTAFVKGTPEKRDSALPYNPEYKPTLGESLASMPTDFIRSGVGVAMEAWSPEVRAARDSIDALRKVNPDAADQVEEATLGKKLTATQSTIKGAAAVGEGVLSIFPFLKWGRAAIGGLELGLLGKTGTAIKLGEEAATARKLVTGLGGKAVTKGTVAEALALKTQQEATEAILKLGTAGKALAQSKTLQTLYKSGINGALYGGLYGLHTEEGNLVKGLEGAALGGTFGLGLGGAGVALGRAGKYVSGKAGGAIEAVKPALKVIDERLKDIVPAKWHSAAFSVGSTMKRYYGDIGEAFTTMYKKASELANADLGRLHLALIDNGLMEAPKALRKSLKERGTEFIGNDTQKMSFFDQVLRGIGAYKNKEFRDATILADPKLKFLDNLRKRYYGLAQKGGLLDAGLDPETYLPKHTPIIELSGKNKSALSRAATQEEREAIFAKNDPMVKEMVENAVYNVKAFKTLDEAYQVYYDYASIVSSGSHKPSGDNKMIEWMILNGQAVDREDAIGKIIQDLKFRKQSLTPQAGSLDFKRKVNLPWYDPNPARVMPQYAFDASMRIEMAKKFGADDETLHGMLAKVKEQKGEEASKTFESFVRTVTGQVQRDSSVERASNFLRAIEVLKMVYAPIINLGQSLNTLLASDFGSTLYGLIHAFKEQNIRDAIERGALTNTLIREIFNYNSGGAKWAENVLRYTGFTYTEMFNRAVASTTSDKWVKSNIRGLLKRYGLKTLSEKEELSATKMLMKKQDIEEEGLRGGIEVQRENFEEFNKNFPEESFKETVGNISAAKKREANLESSITEKKNKLQIAKDLLEKEVLAEAEPFTEKETRDLLDTIEFLKQESTTQRGVNIGTSKEGTVQKDFTSEQHKEAFDGIVQLQRAKLEEIIKRLEVKFDENRALGEMQKDIVTVRDKAAKTPETLQDYVTRVHDEIKSIDKAIASLDDEYKQKKTLLDGIINAYEISEKRALEKHPEGLAYDKWLAERKANVEGEHVLRVGITSATDYIPEIDAMVKKANALEGEGRFDEANKIHNEILDRGESALKSLFKDVPEIKISVDRTKGNFFKSTEGTFNTTVILPDNKVDEAILRLSEFGNTGLKQHNVHISEVADTLPDGIQLGVVSPDGYVYEPNFDFRFEKKLTDQEFYDISNIIQDIGLAGSTLHFDKQGINLYNISAFKDYQQFYGELEQLANSFDTRGISTTGRTATYRKLLNIGEEGGGSTRSYAEIGSEIRAKRTLQEVVLSENKPSLLEKIKREDSREYRALDELGLPVDDIIARGFITREEMALGAQAFVEKTQFLGRPIDLPYFASSPVGKVFFQFKTFAYQQAKFVTKTLKDDITNGDGKKFLRDVLVLTTVFPATGEVLSDVRSLITQEKRPTKFFDRYISDIFSAGTYGLLSDLYTSAEGGNLERVLLGAAPGDIVKYLEQLAQLPGNLASGKGERSFNNITKQLLTQSGFGKPIKNIAYPQKGRNLKSSAESLQDLLDWDGD